MVPRPRPCEARDGGGARPKFINRVRWDRESAKLGREQFEAYAKAGILGDLTPDPPAIGHQSSVAIRVHRLAKRETYHDQWIEAEQRGGKAVEIRHTREVFPWSVAASIAASVLPGRVDEVLADVELIDAIEEGRIVGINDPPDVAARNREGEGWIERILLACGVRAVLLER